ncbi:alpha/beta hydrolase [Pedobacter sp. CFBP9032]|uniref:alpha/beta fold hydrolase n=1 Tax=Pedobacter sp. CFBP9032 TaxID=3096539 RepID=UPI002A6A0135|nr:alpha/beta hydrolase [Pedobacter sp. CFBP9032]MDY0904485.1 alpha/beta hydrolase [Pedobacter sp. CFBP9032]
MKFVYAAILVAFLFLYSAEVSGQNLYTKAYGNLHDPAMIFIHGGPRGNATLFEATTAEKLAAMGFYVIVYDRRGEGRSNDLSARFTFDEAFSDLNLVMKQYHLTKVSLIGHSFGGIISTLFSNQYPEKVDHLILADALFAQQESYNYILSQVKETVALKQDEISIKDLANVNTMDTLSAAYRKLVYDLASRFGYFKMSAPTKESARISKEYLNSDFSKQNIRNDNAPLLFYRNESLVNIDTKPILRKLITKGVKIAAVYGEDDRIFSSKQLNDLKLIVGDHQYHLISNCSHYPFVDQQEQFLKILSSIINGR